MHRLPCEKLTMRVTPKMRVNPAATRNSDDAPASPVSSCSRTASIRGVSRLRAAYQGAARPTWRTRFAR